MQTLAARQGLFFFHFDDLAAHPQSGGVKVRIGDNSHLFDINLLIDGFYLSDVLLWIMNLF
jgi:hypothetical protein